MLNIANFQGNTDKNHNEILPHIKMATNFSKDKKVTSISDRLWNACLCTVGGKGKW